MKMIKPGSQTSHTGKTLQQSPAPDITHPPHGTRQTRPYQAKQSKERNLLMPMQEKRAEVLRFAHDLSVAFDNKQVVRELRMIEANTVADYSF